MKAKWLGTAVGMSTFSLYTMALSILREAQSASLWSTLLTGALFIILTGLAGYCWRQWYACAPIDEETEDAS